MINNLKFLFGFIVFFICASNVFAEEKYLKFQSVKYRTGGANRAFIGSIGIKRTEGDNAFYIRYDPHWSGLTVKKTGSFEKVEGKGMEFSLAAKDGGALSGGAGELSAGVGVNTTNNTTAKYIIYQVLDIKDLVEELNADANKKLLGYLKLSKKFRIITSIVEVKNHNDTSTSEINVNAAFILKSSPLGDTGKTISTISSESIGGSNSIQVPGTKLKLKKTNRIVLSMADNMIYAYEYGRLIWDYDKKSKT